MNLLINILAVLFVFNSMAESTSSFGQASGFLLNGDTASFHSLLKSGAVTVHSRGKKGNTLLHKAILYNNPEAVRILLELGADVDAANHMGETARQTARSMGNTAVSSLIFNAARNQNSHKEENPSVTTTHQKKLSLEKKLQRAVERGTPQSVSFILKNGGADYINTLNEDGKTLLLSAIERLKESNRALSIWHSIGSDWNAYVREQGKQMQNRKHALEIINILTAHNADPFIGRPQNAVHEVMDHELMEVVSIFAKHSKDIPALIGKHKPALSPFCRESFTSNSAYLLQREN